jgi:hypothetical protein
MGMSDDLKTNGLEPLAPPELRAKCVFPGRTLSDISGHSGPRAHVSLTHVHSVAKEPLPTVARTVFYKVRGRCASACEKRSARLKNLRRTAKTPIKFPIFDLAALRAGAIKSAARPAGWGPALRFSPCPVS